MTLLKMIGMGDDLPLRLGARLPRDYERKANVAKMEAAAQALEDMDVRNGPVKWVGDDTQARPSDCAHPAMQESMRMFDRFADRFADRCAENVNRDYETTVEGERVGPYIRRGNDRYLGNDNYILIEDNFEWQLTAPSDAEVRAFYKGRALGRGLSEDSMKLWAKRMDLRQFLRTNGAFVPDPAWRAKVEAAESAVQAQQRCDAEAMRQIADAEKLRDEPCGVPDVMRGSGLQMLMAAARRRDNALQRACDAIGSDLTTAWLRGGE